MFIYIILLFNLLSSFADGATFNLNWFRTVGNQGTTTIALGDTVVWTWTDTNTHTVTSTGNFNSGNIQGAGNTFSQTFNTPGSYNYFCNIHNNMQGTIQVLSLDPTFSPSFRPSYVPSTVSNTEKPTMPTSRPSSVPTSPTSIPSASPTTDLGDLLAVSLTYPEVISSTGRGGNRDTEWSATLVVKEYRHVATEVSFTTRAYCYEDRCSFPGPTIIVRPGDTFTLSLVNELGTNADNEDHSHNSMHSPNTTNIHTHGLHIDPNVDSIFVSAEPGETISYVYEIPEDHAPGLHWYHAHFHGSSSMQLMGGLAGALIVEPDRAANVPRSIRDAAERLLVISHLVFVQETQGGEVTQGCGSDWVCDPDSQAPLCTGDEESSPFNAFRLYTYPELSLASQSNMEINPVFTDSIEKDFYLVNGQTSPTLELVKDYPYLLRVLHAAGGQPIQITSSTEACSFAIIAWDGVYLRERIVQTTVSMVAASRVEFEIVCTEDGVYSLLINSADFMNLVVYAESPTAAPAGASITDDDLAEIVRPSYLADLQDSSVDSTYAVHITQSDKDSSICGFWLGAGSNCSDVTPYGTVIPSSDSETCPFGLFAGQRSTNTSKYISAHKLITYVGAVNEWTLHGLGSAFHPLHVHVNHFQVQSFAASAGDETVTAYYQVGQWRDTIPPVADKLVLRFVAADFTGETVLHCHFQRHEDLGMMDTYLVVTKDEFDELPSSSPTTASSSSDSNSTGLSTGVLIAIIVVPVALAIFALFVWYCQSDSKVAANS